MTNPIWQELVAVAQSVTQALALTFTPPGAGSPVPLPSSQVYAREVATDRDTVDGQPYVMFALGPSESIAHGEGTFEETEIFYPVMCLIVFPTDGAYSLAAGADGGRWRQQIIDAFLDLPRPEASLSGVVDVQVVADPVVDLSLFQNKSLSVEELTLMFQAFYPRPGR